MSHRIIVNTSNPLFSDVTKNGKGAKFGLGQSLSIAELEGDDELINQIADEEIVFTADDLKSKKSKLEIALSNLTAPEFFVDGLVNGDKVKEILDRYVTEFKNGNFSSVPQVFKTIAALGLITQGILVGFAVYAAVALSAYVGTAVTVGAVTGAFNFIVSNSIFGGPVGWIVGAVVFLGILFFGESTQEKQDKAMRWTFLKQDFPTLTNGAFRGSNQRSPARLYGIYGSQKADQIGLFVRDILADALFSKNGQLLDGHPNRTLSGVSAYNAKQELIPFVKISPTNNDQTYVDAVLYIASYISLIDAILSLNDDTLSRSLDIETIELQSTLYISLGTAKVPLYDTMISESRRVIQDKVFTFLDERKEYKTLLNFGNDTQYVAESWRFKPDSTGSIQLKLLTPLSSQIQIYDKPIISRELAKSVIETATFKFSDEIDFTPKLRPYNQSVAAKYKSDRKVLNNITLSTLSMSIGLEGSPVVSQAEPISYNDPVFDKWYTQDYNSSLLNLDFSNYANFVSYGSAKSRLDAFVEKLKRIENISSTVIGSTQADKEKVIEKQSVIRSFDPYEQYLYFASGSTYKYSSSVYYTDELVEYNSTGSWPRSGTTLLSVTSSIATSWYTTQSAIAERFDEYNQNYLARHLPIYIQEDSNSQEFVKFVTMFGHIVDNLVLYIDQMTSIYSTNPDPYKELSMDQVYDVAQSFGLELPNVYSVIDLQKYVESIYGNTDESSRSRVAETWKRFLHSMIYLYKSKGSRKALDSVVSLYGVNPQTLQIKESAYPTTDTFVKFDELSYGLKFPSQSNSYLRVPLVSSSVSTETTSVRFIPVTKVSSSLLTGDLTKWAVDIVPHPSASTVNVVKNYGRVEIFSGSSRVRVASSSYFPLFGEDYTTLTLKKQSPELTIIQTDGDQILYEYTGSSNIPSAVWAATTFVYVGGSGSIKTSRHFDGIVDEVRFWKEDISVNNISKQAYDPGGAYGSSYSSSVSNLYTALKFSQPTSSITQVAVNETPITTPLIQIQAVGFTTASFTKVSRTIKQFGLIVGATVYSSNKTRVSAPPVFNNVFLDSDNSPMLQRQQSIVSLDNKKYTGGLNVISLGVSPTDYINSNIIRTIGQQAINDVIGNPRSLKDNKYTGLDSLFKFYKQNYNTSININEYIDFYRDLPQATSEVAESMVPARTKLYKGIVIESPILSRNKIVGIKNILVGGSNTKTFEDISSGSASLGIDGNMGTYTLESLIPVSDGVDILSETIPLDTTLTPSISLTEGEYEYYEDIIGYNYDIPVVGEWNYYDSGSPVAATQSMKYATHSGYPRDAYDEELADYQFLPFYDIKPRSDFTEYGSVTYFDNPNGVYAVNDVFKPGYQNFLAAFETPESSSISELYSKITLLPPTARGSGQYAPQRRTATIGSQTYVANGPTYALSLTATEGSIKTGNLFSLLAISGTAGLRVRLYRTQANRVNDDITRPVTVTPTIENHGVVFDGVLDSDPEVNPFLLIQAEGSTIYYRITNETGSPITSSLVFNCFAYDPPVTAPSGYLPRHYRFTKDNTTAVKRRKYVGCKAVKADGLEAPNARPPGGTPPGFNEDDYTNPFYSITNVVPSAYTATYSQESGVSTENADVSKNVSFGRLRTDN